MILTGTSLASSYSAPIASVLQFFTIYCIRSELPYLTLSIYFFDFIQTYFFFVKGSQLSEVHISKVVAGAVKDVRPCFHICKYQRQHCGYSLPKTEYIYTNTVKLMIYIVYIVVVVVVVVINMIVVAIKLSNNCKSKETLFKRGGLLQVAVQHPLIQ